jgi:putative two-component system response regulator
MVNSFFSPPNILVVDDVNTNLAVLTEMIHNAGYIARPVTNARQAVSAIEALTPDLILMDISMPEIDGYTFCGMLKKSVKTREIPVIFISALNGPQDRIKGYQSGAVDYITKPFEAEELLLRVNNQLKVHKIQQELEAYNKKLNKIINDQIRKIYDEQKNLILGITKMLESRYKANVGHMERVGKNSRLLALSLQLTPKFRDLITNTFIDAIEVTAPLHDLGIMTISENLLHKPSALDDEEMEIIKAHANSGAEVIEEIYALNGNNDLLKMSIDIVKHHHENWDGTGYPDGLSGGSIPLCARIVAIIHEYDDLVSETVRKQAVTHQRSIEIINEKAGAKFDPDIVSIFNKIQNQLVR